ncbi:hypothetical protein [Streptomyces sp. NPDC097619]|uniref:hypothetical protein n=1 Tax=Streptomyces sp. NPDC097619 TaxID=3157228 RepID=UPI00333255E0
MYNALIPADPVRPSAAEVNDAIRLLVDQRGDEEWPSEAYEQLLEEWAAAARTEAAHAGEPPAGWTDRPVPAPRPPAPRRGEGRDGHPLGRH